jgi:feruloyl-CoA synthase
MRPYRKVSLGPRDVVVERRPDGTIRLRSPHVPLARDVVITGHGHDELGALIFPAPSAPREKFQKLLSTLESTGSSNGIGRAIVLEEPPSLDAGEITDKGSINQRAVLTRRAALVEELYSDSPRVLLP